MFFITSMNNIETSLPRVIASIILLIAYCLDAGSTSFSLALSYATYPTFFVISDLILKIRSRINSILDRFQILFIFNIYCKLRHEKEYKIKICLWKKMSIILLIFPQ